MVLRSLVRESTGMAGWLRKVLSLYARSGIRTYSTAERIAGPTLSDERMQTGERQVFVRLFVFPGNLVPLRYAERVRAGRYAF